MKIIYKYILKQIMGVFLMCLVVFTFVLFIGNMLRIIEMMSKGVGMIIILKFLILLIPFMLAYSIPMSILTAVLLVFARLSADNEITAIRASGINLKYVFKPVLVCALLMVPLCYFINDHLRPNAIFSGRKLLLQIGIQEPSVSLTTGRFNEIFPNYLIYVGQRKGKVYKQVVVYTFENEKLKNVITAESGRFIFKDDKTKEEEKKDLKGGSIAFILSKGVIEEIPEEEKETGKLNRIQFDVYNIEFNMGEKTENLSQLSKKEREMTNKELKKRITHLNKNLIKKGHKPLAESILQEISSIKTRIHNRIALSFSCLVFVLVGIPLGIKVHRSETSIGAGVSLMLVASYYFLMTLGEAFQDKSILHPWLIMWAPNIILLVIGIILVYKLLQK